MSVATPKIPPIHLKFKENYNLILQEIQRLYPKTKTKLSGEFLKIFAASSDDHRDITNLLVEKKEQYFALNPTLNRPQKVVLKGLPINTDIDDIDLTSRGFQVEKVAQFTKTRTKVKLPIFMVELQRTPDSPDIFKIDTCCYLSIKVDTYNRRPGVAQCYNCNLFNHSSVNCHIQTRCLKCGESHKTGDCPIKEKLENPTCINCNQKGHMANSHRCPKYSKVQPKKGEASQNRNKNITRNKIPNPATVKENLSFANVLKGDHQMAPRLDAPSPANSEPEAAAAPREKSQPPRSSNANQQSKDDKAFGFMDAILELKKFFSDYPSLLELGRQLRNAQGTEKTHLGPGDTLHIPNFTIYRNDRPTLPNQHRRGGTALLLKSSLPHYHTPTPPTGTVEATSVTLTPPGSQPIVITSLYISPSQTTHPIHSDLETIFSLGDVSIVCGDFNAHHTSWGCKRNDQRGKIIKNLIDTTNTQLIAPTSPTRFGYNSASIIDFALTRNLPWPSQVESIAELSSDHNPIMINLDTNTRFAFPQRNVTTDWESFRALLSSALHTFQPITARSGEDVEKQSADLTAKILNAHARSSKPVKQHKQYYVSDEIKSLMRENRAEKYGNIQEISDKRILNTLQNKIHRKVHAFQSKLWADDLRSLDPDDGSLWEMSEGLRKKEISRLRLNGRAGIAHTDSDKAEVLACSLESQFQDNDISSDTDYLINRISTTLRLSSVGACSPSKYYDSRKIPKRCHPTDHKLPMVYTKRRSRFALRLKTIKATIRKIAENFFNNLETIDNRTLRKIEIYTPILISIDRETFAA
ncbi:probable RNA-directed DNA polymerase from transposon BS [Trichonephila clavipes]|nr:probable RNA-directed DNA polymerase from transposon BS [Trichonephila clavipes]